MKKIRFSQGDNWPESFNWDSKIGDSNCSVSLKTLSGGLSQGLQILEVKNGSWTLQILPGKGMSIWKGAWNNISLGWSSPVRGPVNPAFIEEERRGGLGWLDGFDEWFCRCGLLSNGPPGISAEGNRVTLHGRIANLPAHTLEVEFPNDPSGEILIRGVIEESSLFSPLLELEVTYRLPLRSNKVFVKDKVTNKGSASAFFELLYHCNIGKPLLGQNSIWRASSLEVAPQTNEAARGMPSFQSYGPSQLGYKEQVFLCKPLANPQGQAMACIENPDMDSAFAIRYSPNQLPCFTVWKNLGGVEEGYVTGLEPATNYPNFIDFEKANGRGRYLKSGESWRGEIEFEMFEGKNELKKLHEEFAFLQAMPPLLHQKPLAPFSSPG